MGLFDRFRTKRNLEAPQLDPLKSHLAFVLLKEPVTPSFEGVAEVFESFRAPSEALAQVPDEDSESDSEERVLMMDLDGVGRAFVALLPVPVPNGEAEAHFENSLGAFSGDANLEDHAAHLMVTMGLDEDCRAVDGLSAFTSLLAAVTKATQAVGVYWGNAGATHTAEFLLSAASEHTVSPRIMLWNGVSRAASSDRLSLLSLGMSQLGLPDLCLSAPREMGGDALGMFFDLLAYIADRGEAIPAGDTIGGSEDQRIPVRYIKSPARDGSIVCAIDV